MPTHYRSAPVSGKESSMAYFTHVALAQELPTTLPKEKNVSKASEERVTDDLTGVDITSATQI